MFFLSSNYYSVNISISQMEKRVMEQPCSGDSDDSMPPVSQVKRPRMVYAPGEPGAHLFSSAPPPPPAPLTPAYPPPPFSMPAATSTPRKDLPPIRMMLDNIDETDIVADNVVDGPSVPAGEDDMDIADFIRRAERTEEELDGIVHIIDGLDLNNLFIHAINRNNVVEYRSSKESRKLTIVLKQRNVRFRFVLHSCGYNNTRCICIKDKLLELPMDERKNERVNPHNVHNLNYVNTIYAFFANIYYKHMQNADACVDPEMLGISLYFKSTGELKTNRISRYSSNHMV